MRLDLPAASESGFGPDNLPYGAFSDREGREGGARRIGVRVGDLVLDLAALADAERLPVAGALAEPTLNAFMALGRSAWREVRARLVEWLSDERGIRRVEPHLLPLEGVALHLPFDVADYVDFYASEHHATNLGRILRPGEDPLTPNWRHLPAGYHGRAGTVVVSGTPVVRPHGQIRPQDDAAPRLAPTARLDFEAEVGFVVGLPSEPGAPVPLTGFRDHVFGVCLVNDWSARDVQAWEYVPLGPFLGKSFCTSISPWIVPLDAFDAAWTAPPARAEPLLPYLDDAGERGALDLTLEVRLEGHVVSRPRFAPMYWTPAQMLAHLTVNGAAVRTGDLYASGTVSGPTPGERGSLIELGWGGREPITLPDGRVRAFLEDGDEVTITAEAFGPDGSRISLGEVRGRIEPAARL